MPRTPPAARWAQTFFEAYPGPVFVTGSDLKPFYRNPAAREFRARPPEPRCAGDAHVAAACLRCNLLDVLATGVPRRWNLRWKADHAGVAAEGTFEVTVWPLRDEGGGSVAEFWLDRTLSSRVEHYLFDQAESLEASIREKQQEAEALTGRVADLRGELETLRARQTELLHNDRMMMLGRLVAGIAHEVHTPLGAVEANVDLLRRRLVPSTDKAAADPVARSLDILQEAARRIHRLVVKLRNFSRLDESPVQPTDLRECLETTLELLRHEIGPGIRVERDYGEAPRILARADALNQVFLNLLLNALQAVGSSGTVTVRLRIEAGEALVEVEDTGPGVPDELVEKVFDPGFSTKRRGQGVGLGLAISRRILRDHRGELTVHRGAGGGACFRARLPLSPAGPDAPEPGRSP